MNNTALAFDTHLFIKQLMKAGMPEQQAEVIAEAQTKLIDEKLATKYDLELLKRDLTIRLGGMLVVAVFVLGVLIKIL